MKKLSTIALFAFISISLVACKKDDDVASTPTACITVTVLDSAKVQAQGLDSAGIAGVIKTYDEHYFKALADGDVIYNQPVYFKNCSGPSNYRVLYTGDAGHILVDSSNVHTLTTSQGGVDFLSNVYTYKYAAAGTYTVSFVCSNIANFGKDIKRAVAKKIITIR